MAYLNIEKLKAGTLYKTDKGKTTVYFKMDGENFKVGTSLYSNYVTTFNMGHFIHDGWEEVSVRKVKALTETAKEILDNVTADVVFKCDDTEDCSRLLEALQNSTEFKWRSGADLLDFIPRGGGAIVLNIKEKNVTFGSYRWLTKGPKDSVFIDFSASKSVLVDTIKIEGVVE